MEKALKCNFGFPGYLGGKPQWHNFLKMFLLISLKSRISLLSCQNIYIFYESWFCNRPWHVWSNSRSQTFNWKLTGSGQIKGYIGIHMCVLSCVRQMSLEVVTFKRNPKASIHYHCNLPTLPCLVARHSQEMDV